MNEFLKCGLYPFSADAVYYSQCISTKRLELADHQPLDNIVLIAHEYQTDLKIFESHINSNLLTDFKNFRREQEPVDNYLYDFWKNFKKRSCSGEKIYKMTWLRFSKIITKLQ